MTDSVPEPVQWAAPPPDLSEPAVKRRFRIGSHAFEVRVSNVKQQVPLEPDTHLVHAAVYLDGRPLAAHDLGLRTPDACMNAWAYLTNRVNETVVQFYAPQQRETGELNPRLGCWGPRPDLVEAGLGESDCSIALLLGISIWTPGSKPPVHEHVFLEALCDTLVEAVSYWALLSQRQRPTDGRLN